MGGSCKAVFIAVGVDAALIKSAVACDAANVCNVVDAYDAAGFLHFNFSLHMLNPDESLMVAH